MEIALHAPLALLKAAEMNHGSGGENLLQDSPCLITDKREPKICLLDLTFPSCLQYQKAFTLQYLKHYVKFMSPEKQMVNISFLICLVSSS